MKLFSLVPEPLWIVSECVSSVTWIMMSVVLPLFKMLDAFCLSLQRKPRKGRDSAEDSGHLNETVEAMDVVAICRPKYKDRPQIARVIQKTKHGYSIHWMTGSYSGPWAVAKKRDGRKKVPWVDTIKESDIIYKKISLTSGQKLTNKVAQTLRALYAAKEGGKC